MIGSRSPRADNPRVPRSRRALALVAGNGSVRKLAMSTPFVRDVAWRFVAGEDLSSGLDVIRRLNAKGVKGTLNHIGTHVHSERDAAAAADEAIAALRGMRAAGLEADLSLKLTQIGLDISPDLCRANLHRVLDSAAQMAAFVWVDMEESRYVEATLGLYDEAREAYGTDTVGIVIQSYLRDRPDDLGRLAAAGSRIRLVKGGYWEAGDVVFRSKHEIDRAFSTGIDRLIREGHQPAIGTHDAAAIDVACAAADSIGLPKSAFEIQMLYGVRSDLRDRLVRDGHVVRCYVPYGGQWYEYVLGCIRRIPGGIMHRAREHGRLATSLVATTERARLRLVAKRALDVSAALVGLVLLSPILACVAILSAATQGRPVLFRQPRLGLRGRPFTMFKFRTMRPPRADEVWYETDAERATRLGRFLRSTSIDELPELWNVLRGDMSLVGPRPLLVEYLSQYTPREGRRHEMRPGITGWAVVNGRHDLRFEDRLELDVWYVDNWSLVIDARILARTVKQVLGRSGVRATQDLAEIDFPARFQGSLAANHAPQVAGVRTRLEASIDHQGDGTDKAP
jgi:lipopolysaccharide/colanic/teichoic acid biosynthesis glycosyltransferase/proline dehydrogenase